MFKSDFEGYLSAFDTVDHHNKYSFAAWSLNFFIPVEVKLDFAPE